MKDYIQKTYSIDKRRFPHHLLLLNKLEQFSLHYKYALDSRSIQSYFDPLPLLNPTIIVHSQKCELNYWPTLQLALDIIMVQARRDVIAEKRLEITTINNRYRVWRASFIYRRKTTLYAFAITLAIDSHCSHVSPFIIRPSRRCTESCGLD